VRANDAMVCPIDYLDLADPDLQPLRRCATACGAAYHAQCITTWHAQLAKEGKALSCPVCRCVWMDALAVGARESAGVTYTTVKHFGCAAAEEFVWRREENVFHCLYVPGEPPAGCSCRASAKGASLLVT
jgi:hypothetical protein